MIKKTMGPHLANQSDCTGCLACVDSCKLGALKVRIGQDGHMYPSLSNGCVSCGVCERVCPVATKMRYSQNKWSDSEPYAAWNTSVEQIRRSASGGIFAALATHVLEQGGSVAGAISDGAIVRHILIDNIEELPRLQGSKYQQSDTEGIYKAVQLRLKDGKLLLFSGTGCQVAGLLSFLGPNRHPNLITVDLICAGVPSGLLMQRFCSEEKVHPDHIRWRDKENGWQRGLQLTITENGKDEKWETKNCFFGGGFLGNSTDRESCYACSFAGAHRMSDFTIGDYWGCKRFEEQLFNGVSVMIIHSAKAKQLLAAIPNIEYHPEKWQVLTAGNPRLVIGKRPMRGLLFERSIMPYAFKHFSYGVLKKMYAGMGLSAVDFPYQAFRYIRWRIGKLIVRRQLKNVLQ